MPFIYRLSQGPYMPQGSPDATNAPTPMYAPGELGMAFVDQSTGFTYLRCRLDSGATSQTPVGAVQANQLAFWKNRSQSLVTNDHRFADAVTAAGGAATGYLNRVAGVFRNAVSTGPGSVGSDGQPLGYICDIVVTGQNVPLASDGTGSAGDLLVVSTAAGVSEVTALATPGTAPTSQVIGVARSTPASGVIFADVQIAFID